MKKLIIAFALFAFANAASATNAIENNLKHVNNQTQVQVRADNVDECTVYGMSQSACTGEVITIHYTGGNCNDAYNVIVARLEAIEQLATDSGC